MQVKNDQKKSYQTVIHLNNNNLVQIADTNYPNARLGSEGNAKYALADNPTPYELESQWDALRLRDIALVNIENGERKKILTKISSRNTRISPNGRYVFGYNNVKKTWFTYKISTSEYKELTTVYDNYSFYLNELGQYKQAYDTLREALAEQLNHFSSTISEEEQLESLTKVVIELNEKKVDKAHQKSESATKKSNILLLLF